MIEVYNRLKRAMARHKLYVVIEAMPDGKYYCLINKQYTPYDEVDVGMEEYDTLDEAISESLDRLEHLERKNTIKEI